MSSERPDPADMTYEEVLRALVIIGVTKTEIVDSDGTYEEFHLGESLLSVHSCGASRLPAMRRALRRAREIVDAEAESEELYEALSDAMPPQAELEEKVCPLMSIGLLLVPEVTPFAHCLRRHCAFWVSERCGLIGGGQP